MTTSSSSHSTSSSVITSARSPQKIALVGRAGSGKSLIAASLVQTGRFVRHALAASLKVALAYPEHLLLGKRIAPPPFVYDRGQSYLAYAIGRILRGEMGYEFEVGAFDVHTYAVDMHIRSHFENYVNDPANKPRFRGALQQFGSETIRDGTPNKMTWVNILVRESRTSTRRGVGVVNDDCRFQNEVDVLRDEGFLVVRVVRPGHVSGVPDHQSEAFIDSLDVDDEIVNDRTPEALIASFHTRFAP